ncbi:hypothetical protein ACW9HO_37900, partial [Nocardia gipuzkoensis]
SPDANSVIEWPSPRNHPVICLAGSTGIGRTWLTRRRFLISARDFDTGVASREPLDHPLPQCSCPHMVHHRAAQ